MGAKEAAEGPHCQFLHSLASFCSLPFLACSGQTLAMLGRCQDVVRFEAEPCCDSHRAQGHTSAGLPLQSLPETAPLELHLRCWLVC